MLGHGSTVLCSANFVRSIFGFLFPSALEKSLLETNSSADAADATEFHRLGNTRDIWLLMTF